MNSRFWSRPLSLSDVAFALVAGGLVLFGGALAALAQDTQQPSLSGLVGLVCGDNGAWILYALGTIGAASFIANAESYLPPPLRVIVHLLALNFFAMMKSAAPPAPPAAADKTAAKAMIAAFVLAGAFGLSACTSAQLTAGLQAAPAAIELACQEAMTADQGAESSLKGGALGTAQNIGAYVKAACATAQAMAALASNPTSQQWLGQQVGALNTLVAQTKTP